METISPPETTYKTARCDDPKDHNRDSENILFATGVFVIFETASHQYAAESVNVENI